MNGGANIEKVELRLRRFVQQQTVAMEFLLDPELSVHHDFMADTALVRLTARMLSDDLPPEHFEARQQVTFEVPASTWQMWKARHAERWYANWLVRRRPVRYAPDPDGRGTEVVCRIDLERFRIYPQPRFRLSPDHVGPVFLHHRIDGPWWENSDLGDGRG